MCLLIMRESFFTSRDAIADYVKCSGLVKGVAQAPAIVEDDMNVMFATNVTGLINMTQAVMEIYKKRKDGGAGDIIMIGSIAGRESYPGGGIYCATKAAVRSFTDALRRELIATRIRVIEIDPGQVETVCLTLYCSKTIVTCHRNFPS
jgi:3-hydroxy acid dehydrogenase / malonic semialdehyde reductase